MGKINQHLIDTKNAYNALRGAKESVSRKGNPYQPPASNESIYQAQRLNNTYQASRIANPVVEIPQPKQFVENPLSARVKTGQQQAREDFYKKLSTERTAKTNAANGTTQTPKGRQAPVALKSGAEIPATAVGSSTPSPGLSKRPFGVNTRGYGVGIGIGTAVGFGLSVAQGESPQRAAAAATGSAIGSGAFGIGFGAVGGYFSGGTLTPFTSQLGMLVGGYLGGIAGGNLYDFFNLKNSKKQSKSKLIKAQNATTKPPLFTGGQLSGVKYIVTGKLYVNSKHSDPNKHNKPSSPYDYDLFIEVTGPITNVSMESHPEDGQLSNNVAVVTAAGQRHSSAFADEPGALDLRNVQTQRADGQPDTGGNIGAPTRSPLEPPRTIIQSTPSAPPAPSTPSGKPLQEVVPAPADLPNQQNKKKPTAVKLPQNTDVQLSFDPSLKLPPFKFTAGEDTKLVVGKPKTNAQGKTETPITIQNGKAPPLVLSSPSGNADVTVNIPGFQPITISPGQSSPPSGLLDVPPVFQPRPIVPRPGFQPSPITPTPIRTPTPITPTPGTTTPSKPATKPGTTTPTKPEEKTPAIPPPLVDPNSDMVKIGAALAGITVLLQGLQKNTSAPALGPIIKNNVCQTTQPGGCTSNAMNDAVSRGNQDLLNKINAGGQLADLALLKVIDDKLGAKIPNGLSGGLGRLSKFLGVDRIFNILNFLAILHNASMLSASLKITLLETLSSVGNATGLLQTSEGDNVDLNQVFNQGVESLVVSLIGAEAWASMKLNWRKYSSIYRAGTNSLSHIGNMFSSIGNGIETIGENTGKIGNAIRAAGLVRENAYNFMAERMNVHTNKFMTFQTKVGNTIEVLEVINEIAENTIEGQEAYTEAVKATAEFKKQLEEAEKNPGIDNKVVKAEAEKIKQNLVKDPTGEDEEGLLSFLTD